MVKNLSDGTMSNDWSAYHFSMGAGYRAFIDESDAGGNSGWLASTEPTDSVITMSHGYNELGESGDTFIVFCWTDIPGYSKMGRYRGKGGSGTSGQAKGPFIYCGFEPAWVMIKDVDTSGRSWIIQEIQAIRLMVGCIQMYLQLKKQVLEDILIFFLVDLR